MISETIRKELKNADKNPQYILLDRQSFNALKEELGIPLYNRLTKYLGLFLYNIETPYKIFKIGYENI